MSSGKLFGVLCQSDSMLRGTTIQKIDPDACKSMWSSTQIQDIHVCLLESSKSACNVSTVYMRMSENNLMVQKLSAYG